MSTIMTSLQSGMQSLVIQTMSGSGVWMDFNLDTMNYNTIVTITSLLFQVIIPSDYNYLP